MSTFLEIQRNKKNHVQWSYEGCYGCIVPFVPTIDHQTTNKLHLRKKSCSSDESMNTIIDVIDQNTIYMLKIKQSVKSIKSQYVKIHICWVLVLEIGLYYHICIDAHYKYDNNQVITSINNEGVARC